MRLSIEKMIYGGAALARHEGKAVFVEGALPGEQVLAEPARQTRSFAEAKLVSVLEPSPERVEPGCVYYGTCGGCQYQHAAYASQTRIKRDILAESLSRAGLRALPEIGLHVDQPWGNRNRIRLHVDPRTHAIGYLQRGSRQLQVVESCPIAAPVLQQCLLALAQLGRAHALGEWCAEVELFVSDDQSQLLMQVEGPGDARLAQAQLTPLCEALRERLPQLAGAAWSAAPPELQGRGRQKQRRPRPAGNAVSWGASHLAYRAAGRLYRVSLGSFFQANRFLVDELAGLATEADTGKIAWDLFAGMGLFSGLLAQRFDTVIAVEGAAVSSADLRANLLGHRAVEQSALSFLMQPPRERPDLVVLDPPRAGLGSEAAGALGAIRSPSVTYVSCDPATLARDLTELVHAGYTITALELVDMFPQTFHLETVARLRLR